jgi:hypothetical protein
VLERNGQNKRRTCKQLDISYHTLQAYLRYPDHGEGPFPRQIPAWARRGSAAAVDAHASEA